MPILPSFVICNFVVLFVLNPSAKLSVFPSVRSALSASPSLEKSPLDGAIQSVPVAVEDSICPADQARICRILPDSTAPAHRKSAEWDKVFKNYKSLECQDQWAKRKEKDIKDLHAHLWGHAYDSPSPAKCE